MTWEAPEGEVTGYQILRRIPEQCDFGYRVYVENTNSTDTHWADRDVVSGTRYEYHVRAVNDVGVGRLDRSISTSLRPTTLVVGPEPNNPATGTPTITGTAQVGETLTADPSGIADADGMHWASLSYQWLSSRDTEIEGATSPTYTLQASDANKAIKVRVDFMDDSGYEESLTSAATAAVSPNVSATGAPAITGTVEVGETLTADTSGIVDTDGLDNVSFSYQWIRSDGTDDWDVDGATGSTYAITAADVDKAIKLRVNFTDDKGSVESLTSSATVTVPIEVAFTFNVEGTTVTCDSYNVHIVNVPIEECDDPTSTDQGASGEIGVEIEIARSVNSQLYKFDFHIYQVEDSLGNYGSREANDLCLGQGLADSVSMEVTPDDRTGNFTYTDYGTVFEMCPSGTFQLAAYWYRYNDSDQEYEYAGTFRRYFFITSDGEVDAPIEKVKWNSALYPDPPVSHGDVQIEATRESEVLNRDLTTYSLSIGGLVPDSDPETTDYVVRLQVIGSDSEGRRRAVPWCHVGDVGYSYQLKTVAEDGVWAMQAHLLGSCLTHWWPDTLRIELFDGTDLTDYSEPIVLDGSNIISHTGELQYPEYGTHEFIAGEDIALGELPNSPATGGPTISGTPQVGETLTVNTSGVADTDGMTGATFTYQWVANDGTADTDIAGATDSTYTVAAIDEGNTVKVRVSFTDDAGNDEGLTSAAMAPVAAAANNRATGAPTISGTAQVGETLTADTSAIADTDGMTIVSYSYQWLADGADIAGANATIYTLTDSEEGKTVQVRVSFTDDAGNEEGLTSAATDAVEARPNSTATGQPTIAGTTQVGEALTADTSGIADADGLTNVSYSYQWLAGDGNSVTEIAGATGLSYTVQADDEGSTIQVMVSFTDDAGNQEELTSPATNAVEARPNSLATGQPSITGTAQVGETLTADTAGIDDHDGINDASFDYQWLSSRDAEIDDATGSTYTLVAADEGKTIKVKVSFTDDAGNDEELTSAATAMVESGQPTGSAPDAPRKPDGTAVFIGGVDLEWDDVPGADTYEVQTWRGGQWTGLPSGGVEIAFYGAGAIVSGLDPQSSSWFQVRAANTHGASDWSGMLLMNATSEYVLGRRARPANVTATGAPVIMGAAEVGETLRADTTGIEDGNGLDGVRFEYQWTSNDGNGDTEIAGATQPTYVWSDDEEGGTVSVHVSFVDRLGYAESLSSAAVGSVAVPQQTSNTPATGVPTISGTAQVGETLTVDTSGIADNDGLTNASYSYQWLSDDTDIAGATAKTYTLVDADEGKTIKVRVSFTDDAGNEESLTSAATAAVEGRPNSPATGQPTVSGTVQVGETLIADTSDISDGDGLDNVSYSYQWLADGADIAGATATTYTLTADDEGAAVKVRVTFTDDAGNEEELTSQATDAAAAATATNSPATGQPAISGTIQVGETLTASTSGISDDDGLINASYQYQWLADDADIAGGTATTYTLVDADAGVVVKVRVSFTDDAGNEETLTSAATGTVEARPNSPATGQPTISGTAQVGETLTADTSGIADQDGLGSAVYSYQWLADDADIAGATATTYTLVDADEGKTVRVRVSFTDDADNEETLTSAATDAVAAAPTPNSPVTKAYITVVIASGDDTVSWSDPGGCSSDYNIYKAITPSGNDSETSHIHLVSAASGSTQATLAISHSEDGQHPAVEVELYCGTYDAASGQNLLISSTQLSMGINIREGTYSSAPLTALTISSGMLSPDFDRGLGRYSAEVPSDVEVITLDPTVLTGYQTDFVKNPGLYTVIVCPSPRSPNCVYSYGDGTTTGIVLSDAEPHTEGFQINLDRGENRLGIGVHKGPVAAWPPKAYPLTITRAANTPATGQPTINGTAQVGEVLEVDTSGIADADGLANVTFSYQWLSSRDTEIGGATSSTYTLQPSDEGKAISVQVSFNDDAGNDESLTSAATDPVAAADSAEPPAPPTGLTAAPSHDQVVLSWDAPQDDSITGYVILRRNRATTDPGEFTELVADTGSAATTYTDDSVAADASYTYRIKAINDHGLSDLSRWVRADTPAPPVPAPPTGLTAAPSHDQVVLSWDAPQDDSITGYVILRRNRATTDPGEFTELVADTGSAATTYTDDSVAADASYTYRIKAINEHGVSELSRWARADTPAPSPANSPATGAPTISGTVQVGETLTADTWGIADTDGLDNVSFSYQWLSSRDTAISGATGETYTLVSTDFGKIIKVKVTFTDDAGNSETLTSAGTAAVVASANSAGICDRTAQVRETILDQFPDTSDCAAVTDTDLSGIIRLALSEMGITTLKSGDFSGLSNLRHLNLVDNELSALSDGIFDDLSELHSLHLNGNELSELPDGIFDNLTQLQSLGLGDNSLSELPGGAFDNLTELQSLSLGDNSLSELPDGAFDNLTELQWLDLGNNDLSELPGGIFDNLTRLRTLKLSHNDLSELPDGIFDNLTELETLYLHWNRLSELPDGIFDNLTALSSLELSNNELSELSDGLFDDLSELQFLHLSDNELSVLPDGAFDSLTKLWSLSVGGNELSALPEDVFVNLAGLQSLDLNSNELSELPDGIFDGLSELHSLHLNGNELNELPDGIFDNLTKLRTLSVDYNELSELPDSVFDNLSELWGLSLVGNELSELPDGIFDNLANLKQLYLFSNKLSELPDRIFYGLASLDVLNIDENTGSPFTFTVELERPDENSIALKVAQATPFDMEVTLSAEGGSLSSAAVLIPAGNVSSEQITVSPDGDRPVTISVVSAAFLLGEFQEARGIQTGLGERLTLGEDSDTDTPATGAPTISGTAQVGETLRADTSGIADADGLTGATFSYQWLSSRDTEIGGATSSTYTLQPSDEGKAISVQVSFNDDAGNDESLTSAATDPVAAAPTPNSPAIGAPTITGTIQVGATLTANTSRVADADGLSNVQYEYQWLADDADISGATNATYTLVAADEGKAIKVEVTFTDDAGNDETLTSVATEAVAAAPTPNSPATGAPTITGTAQVGETLTADTSGIADADGIGNVQYQWLADDAEIAGATATAYTLADADEGMAIKVRVSFTDDAGNKETLTSVATDTVEARPNSPATGAPTIAGTAQVGETLTADTSGIADQDGLGSVSYSYQWLAEDADIAGATATTYTLTDADEGAAVKVRVSFTDDAGNEETMTSAATEPVGFAVQQQIVNTPATGQPTISGMAQVGETLTADTSGIADVDGLSSVSYSYQWLADDAAITGATATTYTLTDADEGAAVKVRVSFTDDAGNDESLTSAATDTVEARPNSPATGAPVIVGTAQVGETLTADTSGIADGDGLSSVVYQYQWLADGADITGATATTYTLTDSEQGKTVKVRVSFMDDAGNDESLTSAATGTVEARPNSPATGAPVIVGTAQVGETLTADTSGIADADGLSSAVYHYQWIVSDGGADLVVPGAKASTYTVLAIDRMLVIKVRVHVTDDRGHVETRTSAPTAVVR